MTARESKLDLPALMEAARKAQAVVATWPEWKRRYAQAAFVSALMALALSGCGMSQLERHATAAGALHAGVGVAAQVVDQGAREAAARAGDADELAEALRPWRQAEAAQHLAAAAVDIYVAEVLAMAATDAGEPDDTRALRALRGAVSAYAALADLLATLGVDIPPVGRVLALVGGAL